MKDTWRSPAVVCIVVIAVYAYLAQSGILESMNSGAAESYYNLLVEGFRAGQLSLKKEAPPEFAQLADPYDPSANAAYVHQYGIHDTSYYKGRLYLYFGITPALVLFWPFVAVTGEYLFHREAVVICCAVGFLASVGLLRALWQRYFPEVSVWVVAVCTLALGLATIVPVMLLRTEVYEVAISCGYMLTILALGAIWCAMHQPEHRCRWLAAASVAYGLAVGARPSLLFGAVILLVPVVQAWQERLLASTRHERWQTCAVIMAATGPTVVVGLGLMLYNYLRFDDPFEFGLRYELAVHRQVTWKLFSLDYLWFNFRVMFLEPARWSGRFPFVHGIAVPPLPAHYGQVEYPFGVLSNIPLVWLAAAIPLAGRGRSGEARNSLHWFLAAVALLFGISALTICLLSGACIRYEVEFLPALVLLAVIGILGLERMLALASNRIPSQESGLADRPFWRRILRCGWGALLGFSVLFNLLACVQYDAEAHSDLGMALMQAGRTQAAIGQFERALRTMPDNTQIHCNFGLLLESAGKPAEAIGEFEQALRIDADDPNAHNNLGTALGQLGRMPEAVGHFERALQINPNLAAAHYNLAKALETMNRTPDAIEHYELALKLQPGSAAAKSALLRLRATQ